MAINDFRKVIHRPTGSVLNSIIQYTHVS